ncbi:insulinase family protein [bacterium]|nr:insulinase family protein [candidate division CSSED10-310 bacterium]
MRWTKSINWPLLLATSRCLLVFVTGVATASQPGNWSTTLDNGMKLMIIEDHSCPLATSVITIRAGSHTESPATNGMSHLLEHLLFDGTTTRTAAQMEAEVPAAGGYFNAFTRKDYVAFEIVMPSDAFMEGLEIQADQLLNSTLPESEIGREKKVVCEEIAQDVRHSGSAAENAAMGILFGDSGYALPVIGNYRTVTDVPRERILSFYKSRYVPNRMTAVVVGDVKPGEVLDKFRALYGAASVGMDMAGPPPLPHFPPYGARRIEQRPVTSDTVMMVFPAPAVDNPSLHAFELAVSIWADSPSSPLQTRLQPFAEQVSAFINRHRGFSLLIVTFTPTLDPVALSPDETLLKMEQAVTDALTDMISADIPEAVVLQQIRARRVDFEFLKEKSNHLARDAGACSALGIDDYWTFVDSWRHITAVQVRQAFRQWMEGCRPVSVWIRAGGMEEEAGPAIANGPLVKTLENGLTVIASYDPYADLAAIHLLTPNPQPAVDGIPRIVAELLDSGTTTLSKKQIEAELLNRSIRLKLADWAWLPFDDYYDSIEYNYIQMECLSEDFEPALDLMGRLAFDSILPDSAWQELAPSMRMLAASAEKRASTVSRNALRRLLFTTDYFRQSRLPSTADIDRITPDMLRSWYRDAYCPAACIVSVTGNIPPELVMQTAEKLFGRLPTQPATLAAVPELNLPGRQFTEMDDVVTSIRAALPLAVTPDLIPAWSVVAQLLSDRLQEDIRGKRGMAYRLGAGLNEMNGCAFLEISVGTRGENLQEVETAVREIVDGISGLSFDSISAAVNSLAGHDWRYRQRRINRAYFLAWRQWMGYGVDYETGYISRLEHVTVDQVNSLVKSVNPAGDWYWAVAGRSDAGTPVKEETNGVMPQ